MNRRNNTKRLLTALALAFAGGACDDGGDPPVHRPAAPDGTGVYGQLVHSVTVADGHTVEFYDVGDGMGVVREMMPVGPQSQRTMMKNSGEVETTLAGVFRATFPAAEVPRAIIDADFRAATARERLGRLFAATADAHKMTPAPAVDEPEIDAASANPGLGSDTTRVQSALGSCSADVFGDNWGAQWYLDNFCTWAPYTCSNSFSHKYCATNWSTAAKSMDRGFVWRQLAGDFNVPGHTTGLFTGFPFPTPQYLWDHSIPPRTLAEHRITGGSSWYTRRATGRDSCGHGHHTRIWCGDTF